MPRSIPACTGKPRELLCDARYLPVYPRVYGEASAPVYAGKYGQGLSPRVRGSRGAALSRSGLYRSIPACTGKPLLILLHFLPLGAYCVLPRDAIQIVKELFAPSWTGSLRENNAFLIYQLNRRRPKYPNDLPARMTRVLPRHDERSPAKL